MAIEFGDERLPERFWAKVKINEETGCWEWTAGARNGYGRFSLGGRMFTAHRLAYEMLVGELGGLPPHGVDLDHLCRRRGCVNPDHLEPVTRAENIRRGVGLTALHPFKTHCPAGHPYSGENLKVDSLGRRVCRECARRRSLKHYHRARAAAQARSAA